MRVIKLNDNLRSFTEKEEKGEYAIVSDNDIQTDVDYCKCYGRFGQQIGCYDAACSSEDNDESGWVEGEEYVHTQADVINYHDGHNWQTILLSHEHLDSNNCDAILLDEDDEVAIKILEQFENAERPKWHSGTRDFETENFNFQQSQFVDDYSIATVEVTVPFPEFSN